MAEFIVAIELGSSYIRGIAGKKNLDGSIAVLAVVKEDASQCIRKGIAYNSDKTVQCLKSIINKLEKQLKHKIERVFVGVGGQSIHSVRNCLVKDLGHDTKITSEMIDELMESNRNMVYPEQEIIDAATQEYKVDNRYETDPVGINASRLEANIINILWRKSFYKNLNNCLDKAEIAIAELYLAPLACADAILTEAEKRSGCVLVDLGADTTTVSVFSKNILRHIAVIPLGANNITKDIASLDVDEKEAERLKLRYASAYTENSDLDKTLTYPLDQDRSVSSINFIEIVESRVREIVENVCNQVPIDYRDKLNGGFILTGGGANLANIEKAFKHFANANKIRKAMFVNQAITSNDEEIKSHNGMMNTLLGLLAKGNINCAGEEITKNPGLFNATTSKAAPINDPHSNPRKFTEIEQGVVISEAEKKALEEKKRKEQEEEAKRQQEEIDRQRQEEEAKKQKSGLHKLFAKGRKFLGGMLDPEE